MSGSWSPPFRVLTSGDGHYIGCVYCTCTPEEFNRAEFADNCPMHSDPKEMHDPFIKKIRERKAVAEVRGIDVTQAVKEQHGRGL